MSEGFPGIERVAVRCPAPQGPTARSRSARPRPSVAMFYVRREHAGGPEAGSPSVAAAPWLSEAGFVEQDRGGRGCWGRGPRGPRPSGGQRAVRAAGGCGGRQDLAPVSTAAPAETAGCRAETGAAGRVGPGPSDGAGGRGAHPSVVQRGELGWRLALALEARLCLDVHALDLVQGSSVDWAEKGRRCLKPVTPSPPAPGRRARSPLTEHLLCAGLCWSLTLGPILPVAFQGPRCQPHGLGPPCRFAGPEAGLTLTWPLPPQGH